MRSVKSARATRDAATPLRDSMDRAGINRNYCVAGCVAVAGCAIFVIFTVLISTGVCHTRSCPAGQEQSLGCNCNIFRWVVGPGLVAIALALVSYECYTREGKKAIMAKQTVASQGLLEGGANV